MCLTNLMSMILLRLLGGKWLGQKLWGIDLQIEGPRALGGSPSVMYDSC